jgi:hypothetical protein
MRADSIHFWQGSSIDNQIAEVGMRMNASDHDEDQQGGDAMDVVTMHHDDNDDDTMLMVQQQRLQK